MRQQLSLVHIIQKTKRIIIYLLTRFLPKTSATLPLNIAPIKPPNVKIDPNIAYCIINTCRSNYLSQNSKFYFLRKLKIVYLPLQLREINHLWSQLVHPMKNQPTKPIHPNQLSRFSKLNIKIPEKDSEKPGTKPRKEDSRHNRYRRNQRRQQRCWEKQRR